MYPRWNIKNKKNTTKNLVTNSQQTVVDENIKTAHNKKVRLSFGTNGLYHVELQQILFRQVLNNVRF